jgi:hypothetical protein
MTEQEKMTFKIKMSDMSITVNYQAMSMSLTTVYIRDQIY